MAGSSPAMTWQQSALISCGRAVDERDVALTQGAAILRVTLEKSAVR
jgi:hypothetical protein